VRGVPLALWRGSRLTEGKTADASGVVAYKLAATELNSFLSLLKVAFLSSLPALHGMVVEQTECQRVFHLRKCIDFLPSLPGVRADLSEELVSYVNHSFSAGNRATLCQKTNDL
jgi:hypothetical protein